jgi:hypothetical protein
MIKIPKNIQIVILVVILILGIFLFFYFFRQMSVSGNEFSEIGTNVNTSIKKPSHANNENTKINLDLFSSEKFINLRSDVAPVKNFNAGKRNPFEPF